MRIRNKNTGAEYSSPTLEPSIISESRMIYVADENDDSFFGTEVIYLDNNMFPEVTFENSPQEVELKLIQK